MKRTLLALVTFVALAIPLWGEPLQQEIQKAMIQSAEAWNRGDLEAFMKGYIQGNELTYTAAGKVVRGSQDLYQRYLTTYGSNKASMGQLRFDEVESWPLGNDNALAMGKWCVDFGGKKPKAQGVFSLVFRRSSEGQWLILHDHTSALKEEK